MNANLKKITFALALGFSLIGAGSVLAQEPARLYLAPGGGSGQPRLGFQGHFEWGVGMVVDYVPWGTPAARVGLEPGDVILSVNGRRLRSQSDYFSALRTSGGRVRLVIEDVRSGGLVARTAWIGGGSIAAMEAEPIEEYSAFP